ncbi:hypothetical protein [Lentilactobacillus hilgardii]|uniref:hypothetical protein n=1 Tax=Lentilactobacillus hilgardii TaxID=1588 RepID=UPI00390CA499
MENTINEIFLVACITIFWLFPVIGVWKRHKIDDRFFFRQWLFPLQYWLQVLFEKWTGNRRSVIRILQMISLFITYLCGLIMLLIFSAFNGYFLKHPEAFMLFEYLLVSSVAYWFQPKAGKVYKTK